MVCHRRNSKMLVQNGFMIFEYEPAHTQNIVRISVYTVVLYGGFLIAVMLALC